MYSCGLKNGLLTLTNEETGATASFLLAYGMAMNQLVVPNAKGERQACTLAVDQQETYADRGLTEYWGSLLFPFPNRIQDGRYEWQGRTYQLPLNHAAEGHAIHGLVYDQPFVLQHLQTTHDNAQVVASYQYDGNLAHFPFPYYLEVSIKLAGNRLQINTEIMNVGSEAMPAGLGWHPYFVLDQPVDAWDVSLPVAQELPVDNRMIPTGETKEANGDLAPFANTHLDTCFTVAPNAAGMAITTIATALLKLEIGQEVGAGKYNYLQVYSPANRSCLAIEPMTCPPNAFNTGVEALEPGASMRAGWWVRW